jgi:hypothetical protein
VRENVIIAYRGANYELGQWPHGYGIWSASNQEPLPMEWWDPTPDGWSAAWYRFSAIEVPGSIVAVNHPGATPAAPAQAPADPVPSPTGTFVGPAADLAPPSATQADTTRIGPIPFFADQGAPGPQPAAQPGHPAGGYAGQAASQDQPPAGYTAYGGQPGYAQPGYGQPASAAPPSAAGRWAGLAPGRGSAAVLADEADSTPLNPRRARIAAALLGVGVLCGIIGLFPSYLGGASLGSVAANLWPHLLYLAAWAVSAVLIVRGGRGQRAGALIATGTSVVTLGLFLADIGYVVAGASGGAGLVLSVLGWLACALGSAFAFARRPAGWLRRPSGREGATAVLLILAAVGAAITFAPSWDSYVIASSSGVSETITAGNAFANPGFIIFADVLVMVALVAVIVVAALWRNVRVGWALVAGALVPMVGQILAAFIQVSEPTSPAQLGISSSEVSQYGLTVQSSGLTAVFWLFCVFVLAVIVATAWLALGRDHGLPYALGPAPGYGQAPGYGGGPGAGSSYVPAAGAWPGAPGSSQATSAAPETATSAQGGDNQGGASQGGISQGGTSQPDPGSGESGPAT